MEVLGKEAGVGRPAQAAPGAAHACMVCMHTSAGMPTVMHGVQGSMEVLGVEWKLVRDDLHRLRQELAERSVRLNTLRAKHATIVAKHGGSAEDAHESEVRPVAASGHADRLLSWPLEHDDMPGLCEQSCQRL